MHGVGLNWQAEEWCSGDDPKPLKEMLIQRKVINDKPLNINNKQLASLFDHNIDYSCLHEYRPNEVMDTVANISNIRRMAWKPTVTLLDGLKSMINL